MKPLSSVFNFSWKKPISFEVSFGIRSEDANRLVDLWYIVFISAIHYVPRLK